MTDWKKSFLESSVLGRATNKDCPSEVLKRCIELAYSDMMTAGRYYSASFLNNKDEICLATNRAIIESNFVFSRKIIEDISLLFCDNTIGNDNHYVTGFGLAQKLINMTFKYLYVFSDLIFIDKPIPNFSSCDCPLDSIIIKKAHIRATALFSSSCSSGDTRNPTVILRKRLCRSTFFADIKLKLLSQDHLTCLPFLSAWMGTGARTDR